MKNFLYSTMTSKEIYNIKKMFHQQSNNANIKMAFETLLHETEIAISNIKEVITSEEELRKLIVKLRAYDFSFAKDILGMSARGDNGSYYRDYLAMDGQNIIEVSFANHYETTKASRSKANNQSQFLFRVVLMTPKTKVKSDSIISPTSVVGNLKVLTNATIRCSSSIDEDLKMLLMSIHDYLISPSETYENAKPITKESKTYKNMKNNVQRINESQLRAIVAESVKKLLREDYNPYTGEELKPQANNQAYNFQINAATQRMQQPTIISLLDKSYNFLNNATQNPKYSSMYIENAMKLIAQVKMYLQANS